MRIRLWQIDEVKDEDRVMYCSLAVLDGMGLPVRQEIYRTVWEPDMEIRDRHGLKELYSYLNNGKRKPEGYHGRSMSVGDVVEVPEGPMAGAWFCDSWGFVQIPWTMTKE